MNNNIEREVISFYQKYNPDKLEKVPYLLEKYKNREIELLESLKNKYDVKDQNYSHLSKEDECPVEVLEIHEKASKSSSEKSVKHMEVNNKPLKDRFCIILIHL